MFLNIPPALALAFLLGCASPRGSDPLFAHDKYLHFFICAGMAAGAALAVEDHQPDDMTWTIALSVPLGVGLGKEVYDREIKGTFFSWRDLLWDALGAAAGAAVVLQ